MIYTITAIIFTSIFALPLVLTVFFIARIVLVKKADIIDTSDITLKIGIALYIHLNYLFYLLFHIFNIFTESLQISFNDLLFIIVAVFPTIYLIVSYLFLDKFFKIKFKLTEPAIQSDEIEKIKFCIDEASERLELKVKPGIAFSKYENIPPFVFGKSIKKSYIVFPLNWLEILKKIGGNDHRVEQNLRYFVIYHELSHLKHKDYIYVSASHSFLKSFKYWISTVIFATIYFLFIDSTDFSYTFYYSTTFGLIYYFLVFLITMSVSKNREYIADARAAAHMPEMKLHSLTKQELDLKGRKVSNLEFLLQWFLTSPSQNTKTIGISASSTSFISLIELMAEKVKKIRIMEKVSSFLRETVSTHPSIKIREKKIKEKYFIRRFDNILSKETAIWLGIIWAFYYNMTVIFPKEVKGIMLSTVSIGKTIDYINALTSVSFIALLTSLSFLLSYTNPAAAKNTLKSYFISLKNRYYVIYISFCITAALLIFFLLVIRWNPYGEKFILFFKLSFAEFFFFIMVFLLSFFGSAIFAYFRYHFYLESLAKVEELKKALPFILIFLGLFFLTVFFLLLQGVHVPGIITGVGIALLFVFYSASRFHQSSNPLQSYELFGNKRFVIKGDKTLIRCYWSWIFYSIYILIMAVAAIIVEAIVKHNAVLSDSFMFGSFGLVFLLYIKLKKYYKPSYLSVYLYLSSLNKYLFILKVLGNKKIEGEKNRIRKKIDSYKLQTGAFVFSRMLNIGSSNTIYNALSSLSQIDSDNLHEKSAEWILGLENKEGGFSPLNGLKPRLPSTYEALSVLHNYDKVKGLNNKVHGDWIKSLQKEEGFFVDSICKYPQIEQTFYALNSLHFIGKLDIIDQKRCAEWVKKTWNAGKKDPQSVFNSVKCLELIGSLGENSRRDVRDNWLFSYGQYLSNFDVDNSLSSFYYFFKTAELVMDRKEDIKNLMPGIEEKVYNNFMNYLEKR